MSDKEIKPPFTEGNRFWERRTKHGPNFKYPKDEDGSEKLWLDCVGYFEWNEANPLMSAEPVKHAGKGTTFDVPKLRAMTIMGLCNYLGIIEGTWRSWRQNRVDLKAVILRVDDIIRQQKFEGAAAGMLNPNIIARDLGLSESVQHKGITVNIDKEDEDL